MALVTLGTNANNSLTALEWQNNGAGITSDDIYTLAKSILNDQINGNPVFPGAFGNNNILFIPNRGFLRVYPGDFVGVDSEGWPVLVSANSIALGPWTHT